MLELLHTTFFKNVEIRTNFDLFKHLVVIVIINFFYICYMLHPNIIYQLGGSVEGSFKARALCQGVKNIGHIFFTQLSLGLYIFWNAGSVN